MWPVYKVEGGEGVKYECEVLGECEVQSLGSGRECLQERYNCFFFFIFLRPPLLVFYVHYCSVLSDICHLSI